MEGLFKKYGRLIGLLVAAAVLLFAILNLREDKATGPTTATEAEQPAEVAEPVSEETAAEPVAEAPPAEETSAEEPASEAQDEPAEAAEPMPEQGPADTAGEPAPEPASPATEAATAEPASKESTGTVEPAEEAEPEELAEAEAAVAAADALSGEQADAGAKASFDIVRVEKDGSALIAGAAAPGAEVSILANGVEIGTAVAGASGEFVAMVQVPAGEDGQTIQLATRSGEEVALSDETVIVLPVQKADTTEDEAETEIQAVVKATPTEVIVVQTADAKIPNRVVLDLVSYDDAGEVSLAGRGRPGGEVWAYFDNKFSGSAQISETGAWTLQLSGLAGGKYTLRLDEIRDGKVASRFETPFLRAFPEEVQRVAAKGGGSYTVQPGNTLWYISTQYYGEGIRYHQIFGANQDKIRDPDLIYPGQVFDIPEMAPEN